MLLCLSLVVFVHGFSQDQLLCFFVYLLLFFCSWFLTGPTPMLLCLSFVVFVHGFSHRTNSYASLFISCCVCSWFLTGLNSYASLFIFCCFCSWFFSRNQLLCFCVYLLCLSMVPHRTPTPMLLCLSCILFMVSHFLALTTLTVRGNAA